MKNISRILLLSVLVFAGDLHAQTKGEDTIYTYFPIPLGKYTSLQARSNSMTFPALRIGGPIAGDPSPVVILTGIADETDKRLSYQGFLHLGGSIDGNGIIRYCDSIPGEGNPDDPAVTVRAGGFVIDNSFNFTGAGNILELFPNELYFGCKSGDFGYTNTKLLINRSISLRNDYFRIYAEDIAFTTLAADLIVGASLFTIRPGRMPGDYTSFVRAGQIFLECDVPGAGGITDYLFVVQNNSADRFIIRHDGKVWCLGTDPTLWHDVAEHLPSRKDMEPGSVVVIGPGGDIEPSSSSYDTRIAGIISSSPTIVMGGKLDESLPGSDGNPAMDFLMEYEKTRETRTTSVLALCGIVECLTDASKGAVRPGDLLVSSDLPGHAMKADPAKVSPGSVIGKAMSGLGKGKKAKIPVLLMLR